MRLATLLTLLLLIGCSSNKGLYSRAYEYPNLKLVVYSSTFDAVGDGHIDSYVYGYDLDGDGFKPDVWAVHSLLGTENERYKITSKPFMFLWFEKDKIVAVQYDSNMDQKINAVSGDIDLLVKWLEQLKCIDGTSRPTEELSVP